MSQKPTAILQSLRNALETKTVTVQQVTKVLQAYQQTQGKRNIFATIISGLGALITLLGIFFFIALFWAELGDFGQIAATLGLGLLFYISGSILLTQLSNRLPGVGFHTIGGVLIPIGIFVFLSKLPESEVSPELVSAVIFLFLTVWYWITDFWQKSNVLTIFTYLYGIIGSFSCNVWLITLTDLNNGNQIRLLSFLLILTSIPLITLGNLIKNPLREYTIKCFEGFGYGLLLFSVFWLLFDSPVEFLVILIYALSIVIGSLAHKYSLLSFSFVAITFYILYINIRYFSDIVSWPIALIISGFILIGSGYGFTVLQRYLKRQNS